MSKKSPYVLWFKDCDETCLALVGGKNMSLGRMTTAGIPVPPGFAVTTTAYGEFLTKAAIARDIRETLAEVDPEDVATVEKAGKALRQLIRSTPIPNDVEQAVKEAYIALCDRCNLAAMPVAVRSSATAEDLPGASFAGQQETYLWVMGPDEVVEATRNCWASLFTDRAITYRLKMGFPHEQVLISVGVQKMVNARSAGVIFTLNPITGDRSRITIDANWGLGESVVKGEVTPDNYLVDKVTFNIGRRTISPKTVEYVVDRQTGKVAPSEIPPDRQTQPCLSDEEVEELTRLAKAIEKYYGGKPQDIEWAVDQDLAFPQNVLILQSRPETVWSEKEAKPIVEPGKSVLDAILDTAMKGKKVQL
ncbi:MAG TPA: PEP/pyruvate-binding domain-containing protein [Anaerolineae bacterium]|nr:PEP/pyruvate-binding domain-containing protein [Anaerolineae bacterium]